MYTKQNQNDYYPINNLYKRTGAQVSLIRLQWDIQRNRLQKLMRQKRRMVKLPKLRKNKIREEKQREEEKIDRQTQILAQDRMQLQIERRFRQKIRILESITSLNNSFDSRQMDRNDKEMQTKNQYQQSKQQTNKYLSKQTHKQVLRKTSIYSQPSSYKALIKNKSLQYPSFQEKLQKKDEKKNESKNYSTKKSKFKPKQLKRKFRVICIAVYFSILFPKYCITIRNLKYKDFKKIDNYHKIHQAQLSFFKSMNEIDIFDCFTKHIGNQKNSEKIPAIQNHTQFSLNSSGMLGVIDEIIDFLTLITKKGKLKPLYFILASFLPGEYPLNGTLLSQELKGIQFDKYGRIATTFKKAHLLFVNYLVIKNIIIWFLQKKLVKQTKKNIKEKKKSRKLLMIEARNIKASLLIFYSLTNLVYYRNVKQKAFNYDKLGKNLQTRPMEPIIYNFKLQSDKKSGEINKNNLIKGIIMNQWVVLRLIKKYRPIWQKIILITSLLSPKLDQFRNQRLRKYKQMALDYKFDQEQLNYQVYKQKQEQIDEPSELQDRQLAAQLLFLIIDDPTAKENHPK